LILRQDDTGPAIIVPVAAPFTARLATFHLYQSAQVNASISWGDGSPPDRWTTALPEGFYDVVGAKTYDQVGVFAFAVSLSVADQASISIAGQALVGSTNTYSEDVSLVDEMAGKKQSGQRSATIRSYFALHIEAVVSVEFPGSSTTLTGAGALAPVASDDNSPPRAPQGNPEAPPTPRAPAPQGNPEAPPTPRAPEPPGTTNQIPWFRLPDLPANTPQSYQYQVELDNQRIRILFSIYLGPDVSPRTTIAVQGSTDPVTRTRSARDSAFLPEDVDWARASRGITPPSLVRSRNRNFVDSAPTTKTRELVGEVVGRETKPEQLAALEFDWANLRADDRILRFGEDEEFNPPAYFGLLESADVTGEPGNDRTTLPGKHTNQLRYSGLLMAVYLFLLLRTLREDELAPVRHQSLGAANETIR
jgi:hypothetical protein